MGQAVTEEESDLSASKTEMKETILNTEKALEVATSEVNVKSSDELEEQHNEEKTKSFETESDNDETSNSKVSIAVGIKTKKESQEINGSIEVHEKITTGQKDVLLDTKTDQSNETESKPTESEPEEAFVETNVLDNLASSKEEAKFAPGVLELTVERASQLVNNDKIGKSDPYVKITYRDEEFRSKTVKNTLEPEWNFSCEIDIADQEEKYIHINVYDDDFGKDNIEGCYSLSVTEAISDIPKDGKWYSLVGCKTGKVFISTKFTPIKMADSSTEKPVQESITKVTSSDLEAQNFEKAEKIVGDIVQKAEKVIGEVQAQLNETESSVKITKEENKSKISEVTSDEKDDEFIKISKESEEIIQKMEKTFVESQTVTETSVIQDKKIEKKEESLTLQSSTKADSFQEIEKESKEIVSQLEKSFVSSEDVQDTKTENEDIVIKPGFLRVIVFKASELVNKDMIGKSDPFVRIMFRDQELKSRKVRNSLEPEWNFSANLVVSSSNGDSDIVLEVYDDDFGKENFIGSYTFSLKHAIKETDKEAIWYNLVGCKSGKIFFSTIYSPDEEPATKSDSKEEKLLADNENKEQTIKSFAQDQNKNDKAPQEKEVTPKIDIKDDRDEKEKEISTEKDQSESASDDSSESSKSSQEKEAVNERKETEVKSSETNEEKQITATKKEA